MSLIDDILRIRSRSLSDLDIAHDYFMHTRFAWSTLQTYFETTGDKSLFENVATGSVLSESELFEKSQRYIAEHLMESTFQQFLSVFDAFFFDILQSWLKEYPESLKRKQVDYQVVLDSPDKEAITLAVINKELNEVSYKRIESWFKYLNALVNLNCPADDEIDRLAEAKATRDLLVHNRGIVNEHYLQKAGKLARAAKNERIEILPDYHQGTWALIRKTVDDITNAAIGRLAIN